MNRDMMRERYIDRLEGMLWDGEITEGEFDDMLSDWDRGYDLAQEELWEAGNDR